MSTSVPSGHEQVSGTDANQDGTPEPSIDAASVVSGRPVELVGRLVRRPGVLAKRLGPGIIAGASDNDPTTVASLSVIGATTGYGLSWLVVLVIPMLVVVQVISAALGVCAHAGLAKVVRQRYGRFWAMVALMLVVSITVLTLAADLEGGAAAVGLLTGLPARYFVIPIGVGVGALLVWGSYKAMQNVLKWVVLVFVAYVLAAFLARPNWGAVVASTLVPHFSFSGAYVAGALALLGTTLTSYAYVWQTIEEGKESRPMRRLWLAKTDAAVGILAAGIIMWFIVIATGATLGVHHKQVQTAQDAAAALAPIAGRYASLLFGLGLLASAVLAVPVLGATCAYVAAETFGWSGDLDTTVNRAPRFYAVLLGALAVGVALTFLGIGAIQLLFLSSLAGGLATPGTLAMLMLVARDRTVMHDRPISGRLAVAGWVVTAIVAVACVIFLWTTFAPGGG